MYDYAFFDVDSLEPSAGGKTFVCHASSQGIAEELLEAYTAIGHMATPLVFTMDVEGKRPGSMPQRRDFLTIPRAGGDEGWRELIPDRFKFYLEREDQGDAAGNAVFSNNPNAVACVEAIRMKEWIVFGRGIRHGVGHVVGKLLELGKTVRYVPELIVPGKGETMEQVYQFFADCRTRGIAPFSYNNIMSLVHSKK